MTVQEFIDILEKIEDRSQRVIISTPVAYPREAMETNGLVVLLTDSSESRD
tara:strand:- start:200 stop:352 length:153 start_codon:yes stop_codon:yes gene_type:complete